MGGTPLGAPFIGWVANNFGPRVAITVGAAAGIIACLFGLIWMLASGRMHRHENRRFRLTIDETRSITVVRPVEPAEFSDEVAATTPIRTERIKKK